MRSLDHKKAIELRMAGKSYNEIAKDLDVGKSLLSYWLKNLELPAGTNEILKRKSNYSKEIFAEYNKQKHEKVQGENKEIRENFSKKIKAISDYELTLLGASLYWGEGYKRHGSKRNSYYVSFSNSDPDMVRVFIIFVKKILKVSEDKIKPSIHIYPNTSESSAIKFWSKIIDISKDKFYINRHVSRASQGKRPNNLLPYGTLELRIFSRQKFYEIMGLIDGIIKKSIK